MLCYLERFSPTKSLFVDYMPGEGGKIARARICSGLPLSPLTLPARARFMVYSRFKRFTPGFYIGDFLLLDG